jgi:uncharacterized membrane protein
MHGMLVAGLLERHRHWGSNHCPRWLQAKWCKWRFADSLLVQVWVMVRVVLL